MTKIPHTLEAQGFNFESLRFMELIYCYGGAMHRHQDELARAAIAEIEERLETGRIAGFDALDYR